MLLIFKRVINVCWFCFKWGLLLGVLGLAVTAFYVYYRVDEEIRCSVQQRLAQHYAGLKVTVRSAELVEGKGIEVHGLSILEPGAEGPRAELIYCDELFLSCTAELPDLVGGELQITRITIRRPTLRATRRPDGTWSAAKLLPLPRFCERPPEVTIQNGSVEIFDPLKTPSSTLTLRQLSGTLSPPDTTSPTPHVRKFRGTLSADHLRGVEVEGSVDPQTLDWTCSGRIEGLDVSPEFSDALPGPLAAKLAVLRELRAQGTLSFRVSYNPAEESPYRFDLSGRIVRGTLDDPRLPHPLTDLRATFHVSNGGFVIDDLAAQSGQAEIRSLSARQAGFELGKSPLWLEAEIRQLELDRPLFERLPETLQDQWQNYRPEGQINAGLTLYFDGQTWHPHLSVEFLNVSFAYFKFPYRLEHGKGTLKWKETPKGDCVEADLTAYSGSQAVQLNAEVYNPSSSPSGWFKASGEDLRLDKKLLDALSDKPRAFVGSLHPSGTVDLRIRIWRDVPGGPLHRHFAIDLNRCSMWYENFPYPLSNICGTLEMLDDEWTCHGLEGTNDTGRVTCQQGWLTSAQRGRQLYFRLRGTNVPLDEELYAALGPDIQLAWRNLRPQGTVDLVADVYYQPELKQNRLSVAVTACPKGDSTSIEPVHFPYRMGTLRVVLVYKDGNVTLKGFRAEHGRVKISATGGECDLLPDGSWSLQLKGLTADGLRPDDRNLIQALPPRLKKAIIELKPSGPINLHGELALEGGAGLGNAVRSRWDLTVIFRPAAGIDYGVKLENLSGSVRLAGASDGRHFYSRGELDIDSLTYKDLQFTRVMGPLWIDDRQVLLGSWVDRQRNEGVVRGSPDPVLRTTRHGQETGHNRKPRPLTAKLFGGTVYGDAWIMLGTEPRYGLRATLSQADLSRFAQEVMAGRQNLRGKITATADLRGSGRSLNGLGGRGAIQLRQGDVYELPLMIALLKILSIRPPDQTAFSTSDIAFRIDGGHVYFDPINFNGDAISLLGYGEMDFQQSIRMTFNAIVGRGDLPLIKELLSGASQQIMLIHAGGTLQNPEIRNEPFPVVGQALQLLQEDLQKGTNPQSRFPQTRHWMPNVGSRSWNRK